MQVIFFACLFFLMSHLNLQIQIVIRCQKTRSSTCFQSYKEGNDFGNKE